MLGIFQGVSFSGNDLAKVINDSKTLKDPKVIPHVASILSYVSNNKVDGDIQHLSNIAKQTQPKIQDYQQKNQQIPLQIPQLNKVSSLKEYYIGNFLNDMRKLQLAGYGLNAQEVILIGHYLTEVAEQNKAKEVRFWGKIFGAWRDYYVIQGIVQQPNYLEQIGKGNEKRGEGANYYTFWVSTNLAQHQWTELPLITTSHVKIARKIKLKFSGNLQKPIYSFPPFEGEERHYLKAQLVRMTSSLQLVPKGIYKPNDENPKIVELEDQPKVPQFSELSTLQTWAHRNQNLLNLGRCTHYIDPSTPQDQLEAVTAELTEKDPQIQRLRGIAEDKLPQGNQFNLENIWQIRVVGSTQVFQKDETSNVYGVVVLKNLHWPGWVTLGYKGGFTNYYIGFGLKWTQTSWSQYQNANLSQQAQQLQQFREPNPKDEPKPVAEVPAEPAPQD